VSIKSIGDLSADEAETFDDNGALFTRAKSSRLSPAIAPQAGFSGALRHTTRHDERS
jgi:hypothetical protein